MLAVNRPHTSTPYDTDGQQAVQREGHARFVNIGVINLVLKPNGRGFIWVIVGQLNSDLPQTSLIWTCTAACGEGKNDKTLTQPRCMRAALNMDCTLPGGPSKSTSSSFVLSFTNSTFQSDINLQDAPSEPKQGNDSFYALNMPKRFAQLHHIHLSPLVITRWRPHRAVLLEGTATITASNSQHFED